jgi:glutaminyl-peptide cyclotransferase
MKRNQQKRPRGLPGQTALLAVVVVGGCVVLGYLALYGDRGPNRHAEAAVSRLRLEDIPLDGARAYGYLKQLCAIGRRPSGSTGMQSQQKLLAEHFQKLGGQVEFQRFQAAHPADGSPVPMGNLIVRWHPQNTQRVLLCTHYDTLPFPMLDRRNPRGTFIGANDGTSGVAVLMELAHQMPKLPCKYGVDFVLFDGEEFVFAGRGGSYLGSFFLGSGHFARAYAENPPPYRYRWGVLLDMVGDADLQIYQERYSMSWDDTRPLVEDLWATARRLGVREFIPRQKYFVRDDHLPLHDTGKIPTCDVIDFDYPPWHTQGDVPQRCSALSLAKVGWVLREWLKAAP